MTKTNDINYFHCNVLNKKVFFHAGTTAFKHVLWTIVWIGLPIVAFGIDGSILEKGLFLLAISTCLVIPYVIACFIFHNRSLKTSEEKDYFYSLSPTERGKIIGDVLSGWI